MRWAVAGMLVALAGGAIHSEAQVLECTLKTPEDCVTLAEQEKDAERAAQYYRRACKAGSAEGCNRLGVVYADGRGVPKDPARARALYQESCDKGFGWGCYNLGHSRLAGRGGAKDTAGAVDAFDRACRQNLAEGCNALALRYDQGQGVAKDEARAVTLYERACDGGLAVACHNLGLSYRNGQGVAKDPRTAARYLRRACDAEKAEYDACNRLGVILYDGEGGVEKDYALAAGAFLKACEGGEMWGCYNLGKMHRDAVWLPQNAARAEELIDKACQGGIRDACPQKAASPTPAPTPTPAPAPTPPAPAPRPRPSATPAARSLTAWEENCAARLAYDELRWTAVETVREGKTRATRLGISREALLAVLDRLRLTDEPVLARRLQRCRRLVAAAAPFESAAPWGGSADMTVDPRLRDELTRLMNAIPSAAERHGTTCPRE